ncbi:MAG: hypothetical protein J3R72DRAFT_232149 [Linnemannia gamsii]|nr:MAG: hypothetical protein J3R72DRAFT_232149 [Linnemannia gamsii]
MSSESSSSRHTNPIISAIDNNNNHHVITESSDTAVSELDDYFYALFVQGLLILDDREAGTFGKLLPDSDPQIAIDYMLKEAQEMEESYKLAKSLSTCDAVPDNLLEELRIQDDIVQSDRDLLERVERGESSAESSLAFTTAHFQLVLQHFDTTGDCCACDNNKRVYNAPCGHAYCEECTRSLYSHALTNRAFIPVRCCKVPFASALVAACLTDAGDIDKYDSLKCEIENPCPPSSELDVMASRTISENGWKVCGRCGAVVERISGCVHITCMCRNEFCYTCQKTWRTCVCELYPVEELNRILNERIGNDDAGIVRHRLQNELRNYYQHEHNWERRNSSQQRCGNCSWNMPRYCFHCQGCMETRCHRCTFNN